MTTPFALLDNLGPKQLPESIQRHVKSTKKFLNAAQSYPLRLKTLDFCINIEDFDGFSSKIYEKQKKCASACVCDDKK